MSQIPTGPIETRPDGAIPYPEHGAPRGAVADLFRGELLAALDGVELGAYDRRIVDWLAGWDGTTVATVCSWLVRARSAASATDT
jgi:hypothetical protein